MRVRICCLVLSIVFLRCGALAQGPKEMTLRPLELGHNLVDTKMPLEGSFGPIECDDSGAIYARFVNGSADNTFHIPITKIARDGTTTTIGIPSVMGQKGMYLFMFAVSPGGEVYEVLRTSDVGGKPDAEIPTYLQVFSKTGDLRSNSRFDFNFYPNMLVPLQNDSVFIGGLKLSVEDNKIVRTPLMGIFSSEGQLTRQLTTAHASVTEDQRLKGLVNPALQNGTARMGGDGNIYILLANMPAKVEVVSQAGEAVREFTLQPPFENAHAMDMLVSARGILVTYNGPKTSTHDHWAYVVYDNETGAPVTAFAPKFFGAPSCWDGSSIVVLEAEKNATSYKIGTAAVP